MRCAPLVGNEATLFTVVTSTTYHLAEDTFACLADNRLVFADLRNDKYRCLNSANTRAALGLFPGFRERDAKGTSETPDAPREDIRFLTRALVTKGLLVRETRGGKPVAPVFLPSPTRDCPLGPSAAVPASQFGHWAALLEASLKASAKLRLQSLRRTVYGVQTRRQRGFDPSTQDAAAMLTLVAIFHRLRPFYPRAYICRFDSLALIEFLAHYRQFPRWVFGVKAEPFGAHCWVQENDCVLNDSVDYISQFTPIMAF